MTTPAQQPKLDLGPQDWIEVYYALEGKAALIRHGKYGPDGQDGVPNVEWARQLERIARKLGRELERVGITY